MNNIHLYMIRIATCPEESAQVKEKGVAVTIDVGRERNKFVDSVNHGVQDGQGLKYYDCIWHLYSAVARDAKMIIRWDVSPAPAEIGRQTDARQLRGEGNGVGEYVAVAPLVQSVDEQNVVRTLGDGSSWVSQRDARTKRMRSSLRNDKEGNTFLAGRLSRPAIAHHSKSSTFESISGLYEATQSPRCFLSPLKLIEMS
jgi:hypothetical protein